MYKKQPPVANTYIEWDHSAPTLNVSGDEYDEDMELEARSTAESDISDGAGSDPDTHDVAATETLTDAASKTNLPAAVCDIVARATVGRAQRAAATPNTVAGADVAKSEETLKKHRFLAAHDAIFRIEERDAEIEVQLKTEEEARRRIAKEQRRLQREHEKSLEQTQMLEKEQKAMYALLDRLTHQL
jgi:hypothetical protein